MSSPAPSTFLSALRVPTLVLALGANAACVSDSVVDIDAKDSVRFANFEVSIPLDDGAATRLRLRGSNANGEFDQSLDADERIEIGDTRIRGPAVVEGDVDLSYFSLAIGWNPSASGSLSADFRQYFYLGVARTDFELALKSDGKRYRDSDRTTELYLQYGLQHAVSESLAIGFDWAVSLTPELSGINEIDLTLDYRLTRQVFVFGGYRWLDYVYAEADLDSEIRVDFCGPFIGLAFAL